MSIKDLAVAYNGSENSKAALILAIQMCKKYNAVLTGLYVRQPVDVEPHLSKWISPGIMESQRKAGDDAVKYIQQDFRETVAATGFDGAVEWLAEEGETNEMLTRAASYYDVLLIGQFSNPGEKRQRVRAEDLVQLSGRPLIIVPNGYKERPFVGFSAVAWDGSRPAARALATCIQFIDTKKRLDVLSVNSAKKVAKNGFVTPDIIQHLERHDIAAQAVNLTSRHDQIGPTILNYCDQSKPDFLVIGAYGHTRLREDLFGGVTRHVLLHMNIPVLMTH